MTELPNDRPVQESPMAIVAPGAAANGLPGRFARRKPEKDHDQQLDDLRTGLKYANRYFLTYVFKTNANTSSRVSLGKSFFVSLRRPGTSSGVTPFRLRRSNSIREQISWAVS